jgi:hypothetical protein
MKNATKHKPQPRKLILRREAVALLAPVHFDRIAAGGSGSDYEPCEIRSFVQPCIVDGG